jgi:hypothetical protein
MDLAQRAHPELVHTVRYEELTRDPETVMRGVLDFLGEPWEPKILDYQSFEQRGNGDYKSNAFDGIIAGNTHKYLHWAPGDREAVLEIIGPRLAAYGYSVADGIGAAPGMASPRRT